MKKSFKVLDRAEKKVDATFDVNPAGYPSDHSFYLEIIVNDMKKLEGWAEPVDKLYDATLEYVNGFKEKCKSLKTYILDNMPSEKYMKNKMSIEGHIYKSNTVIKETINENMNGHLGNLQNHLGKIGNNAVAYEKLLKMHEVDLEARLEDFADQKGAEWEYPKMQYSHVLRNIKNKRESLLWRNDFMWNMNSEIVVALKSVYEAYGEKVDEKEIL